MLQKTLLVNEAQDDICLNEEIRKKEKNFLDLCFSPQLAAKYLATYRKIQFDFIILFCDILVIPHALNQKVQFKPNHGPLLNPISSIHDLDYRNTRENLKKLSAVFETVSILRQQKKEKKLIGFCGGPFTVMNYMIEGGSSTEHKKIKAFIKREEATNLIKIITEMSIEYLKMQIDHGVDYVKIFDLGGLLEAKEYYKSNKNHKEISESIRNIRKNENHSFPKIIKQNI